MKLVVISPEAGDPRECDALRALIAAGLERYHVRKPAWSRERLVVWLRAVPAEFHPRLVLHSHHELAAEFAVGGVHFRDDRSAVSLTALSDAPPIQRRQADRPVLTTRSCHDLATLRASLGRYDAVFLSPIFPSLSKPGHTPRADFDFTALTALLANRSFTERRTAVLALGGITSETAPRALTLGFDGVAVLGAIWLAADPVRAFSDLQNSLSCHAA